MNTTPKAVWVLVAVLFVLSAAIFVRSQPAAPPSVFNSQPVMVDTNNAVSFPANFWEANSNQVNALLPAGGSVVSVFGRGGAVLALSNDFTALLIADTGWTPTNYTKGNTSVDGHLRAIDEALGSISGAGVSDGDKGDITVSASGATWTIDNGVVQNENLGGDITTAGKALLDDADAAAQRTTLGLGTAATQASTAFAAASHAHAGEDITSGTVADARIASTIARDSEVAAGYQPLDSDLTALAGLSGATGDIIYYSSGWQRLAKGTDGQVLKSTATIPAWAEDISGGAGVSDGDKGDITVSSSGATWTIDDGVVGTNNLDSVMYGLLTSGGGEGLLESTNVWTGINTFSNSVVIADGAELSVDVLNVDTLNVTSIDGSAVSTGIDAANISTGELADARLSANVPLESQQLYQRTNSTLTLLVANPQLYQATNVNLTALAANPQLYQSTNSNLTTVSALTSGTATNFLAGDGSFKQVTTNMIPGLVADIAAAGTIADNSITTNKIDATFHGLLTAGGGGGGTKTIARLIPADYNPPAASYATFWTRNSRSVLEFDDAADESAVWIESVPEAAVLTSGLEIEIDWMGKTATSGNVRWCVQIEGAGTDDDSDSFDTAACATSAANGTSGIISTATITITTIDSIAAEQTYYVKIYRDADDGTNDTMTGDAQLRLVRVKTAN